MNRMAFGVRQYFKTFGKIKEFWDIYTSSFFTFQSEKHLRSFYNISLHHSKADKKITYLIVLEVPKKR
ncbi:hypothetical protein HZH66_003529 [Vespula vulgaris]|uniref:Uncharacterized protein n=1 Tax=Vespula vulgaris TaxID=7454 RepID=A0A834KD99_VESVU|nr:hypothetical protein HZH66_003529 [Vespula vulgaris]